MTDHGHPVDLLPELALGVLPPAEAAPVQDHVRTCEACAAEYRDLDRVASLLPLATVDSAPSPAVKDRLMQRIAAGDTPAGPFRGNLSRWRWLGLAAAALLLVAVVAGVGGYLVADDEPRSSSSIPPEEYGVFARAVAQGLEKRSTVTIDGTSVAVVHAPGRTVAYVWVDGLPDLAEGQVYQPWVSRDGGRTVEKLASFTVPNGGVWLQAPATFESYSWFAVSIENDTGSPGQPPFITVDIAPEPPVVTPEYQ